MAIKEAMRLYPPAYALGRLADIEQQIGGYLVPAGAYVGVSQFATHRHPQFWDDPEAFDPARFTPEREARAARLRLLPVRRRPASLHRIAFRDARGHHRPGRPAAALPDPQPPGRCAAGHRGHHAAAEGHRSHPADGPLDHGAASYETSTPAPGDWASPPASKGDSPASWPPAASISDTTHCGRTTSPPPPVCRRSRNWQLRPHSSTSA